MTSLPKNSHHCAQSGMSLFEILIAITLLSFLSLSISTITKQSFQTQEEVGLEDADALRVYTFLALLEYDLLHFYSPLLSSKRLNLDQYRPNEVSTQEHRELFEAATNIMQQRSQENKNFPSLDEDGLPIGQIYFADDSITFMTNNNRRKYLNEHSSNFSWISYQLAAADEDDMEFIKEREKIQDLAQPGKVILRWQNSVDPFGDDDKTAALTSNDRSKAQVMFDKVDEWKWEFWNPDNKKFEDFNTLPESKFFYYAIQLTVKYRDRQNHPLEVKKIIRNPYPWSKRKNFNATPIPTASPSPSATP
ncbi:MAG: hypothetical protein QE271_04240 [Bacteriovoracaceae bacterium]|nr:hypothetical protein [Bacteriovoracaceae bacterium]